MSGYGGDDDDVEPSSTTPEDNDICPFLRLGSCIITRPPSWFRGSAPSSLGNQVKRFLLYKKFWTLLGQLGVWNDPVYLALKVTKTSINDRRDVMPKCVVTVSKIINIVHVQQ